MAAAWSSTTLVRKPMTLPFRAWGTIWRRTSPPRSTAPRTMVLLRCHAWLGSPLRSGSKVLPCCGRPHFLRGADALPGLGHHVDRQEPLAEGKVGVVEDGPGGHRELVAA